jgi:hypothetical protein
VPQDRTEKEQREKGDMHASFQKPAILSISHSYLSTLMYREGPADIDVGNEGNGVKDVLMGLHPATRALRARVDMVITDGQTITIVSISRASQVCQCSVSRRSRRLPSHGCRAQLVLQIRGKTT